MRRHRHHAITAATTLLLATAATPAAASPTPPATTSHYISLTGTSRDLDHARTAGCEQGRTGRHGLRILFLGTQEENSVLRPPGTTAATTAPRVAAARSAAIATHWATGFTQCRTHGATAVLALGVNNKSDGGLTGTQAGRDWAHIINTATTQATTEAVTIAGAVDAEPAWSTPTWARTWVDAFTQTTTTTLFAANSADGCPTYGSTSTTCNNGWTIADLHHVSTGASPHIKAIPQIYRTDGIQARQWSRISSWGTTTGHGPLRFAGALSQSAACAQRGCTNTDNTPAHAWTQLFNELRAHHETHIDTLPYSTDMSWAN